MKLTLTIADTQYQAALDSAHCIAIGLSFDGPQPNHFGVARAESQAIEGGGFVGDTRRGGSCNVDKISLTPHCNGTHTECVGHIVDERQSVHELLQDALMPATLITVSPEIVSGASDDYIPALENGDTVITQAALKAELNHMPKAQLKALVIRTLPNDFDKQSMQYDEFHYPPFLTLDAMKYLAECGVVHLLVDFPSVDKMYDQGKLSNHHQFWQVSPQSKALDEQSLSFKTITEMVYVAPFIADGLYLLNLQIAPFNLDAAPSRPWLIPLEQQP